MQWEDLLGHTQQKEWFRTALGNGRLATSFLFVGPEGIGKRVFARLLAKSLLCRTTDAAELTSCGQCDDCAQVEAGTHPDLLQIAKPPEKAFLPVELLIGEREKRMREGLCHDICLRPYGGRRKVAILDDADFLNVEGANCLLKTLEEPPSDSVLILIGTSLQRQLPTIRSRCQAILFQPLGNAQAEELLLRQGLAENSEQARELVQQCRGNLAEAAEIADPDLQAFQATLLEMLAGPQLPIIELAKSCASIVDAAGKDGRIKRERMKWLFRFAAAFYRLLALRLCAVQTAADTGQTPLGRSVEGTLAHWRRGPKGATLCWQRCLTAIEQVEKNANQASLLEAWSADLAQLSGG